MIALAVRAVRQRDQAGPIEPTGMPRSGGSGNDPGRFLPVLMLLFLGSGMSALIYEIVWYQLLHLAIGSTAVSIGILLATFMGGLGLGSWLLPRVARVACRRGNQSR
jgi:spermidine synthase